MMQQLRLFDTAAKPLQVGGYISSIWSFPSSEEGQLYRWYGTLPRPLVQRLISLYVRGRSSRILDPFAGLGTTLVVAAKAHLRALGIDNNPLACLAAELLLDGIPSAETVIKTTNEVVKDLNEPTSHDLANRVKTIVDKEEYSYMRKWFRKDTLHVTLSLLLRIAEVEDVRVQRLLFLLSSQIVRDVANVDPRCTHHLVTKKKLFVNPVSLLKERVPSACMNLGHGFQPSEISVTQGSVLDLDLGKNSFDFVLAHPPYLGVIHYHLIHRLATDLLDVVKTAKSPLSLSKLDLDYSKIKSTDVSTDNSDRYSKFVKDFANVMKNTISNDGRCVVIIGDQRYRKNLRHPFTDFINSFEMCGFFLEDVFIWILQNNAGMHVLRRGNYIDHNYILVFHKSRHSN